VRKNKITTGVGGLAAPALVKLTKMAEDPKEEPWVQDRAREAMNKIDSDLEAVKKEKKALEGKW